jgi:galactoside O-acetyltransferase
MLGWNEEIKRELGSCGVGVKIGYNTLFTSPKDVHLADYVRIDPFCLITTSLYVESFTQICSHVVIGGGAGQGVNLGRWTFIGYGSKLFTASEDYSGEFGPVNAYWGKNKVSRGNIQFQDFSGVASDVIVMPGITLPEGCTIGAKSFVYSNDSLYPWSVLYGNPLRLKRGRYEERARQRAVEFEDESRRRG